MTGMFKGAIRLLLAIIFSPKETWKELSEGKGNDQFFERNYLYPVMLLVVFSSFVGALFSSDEHVFQAAVKEMIITLIVVVGGYFISSYILNEYLSSAAPEQKNLSLTRQFIGYSSSLNYALHILVALLNDLFFLWIFSFYTVYLVYLGSYEFIKIEESRRGQYVVVASSLVLLVPYFIRLVMGQMINKA
jgi:hypothetical protein